MQWPVPLCSNTNSVWLITRIAVCRHGRSRCDLTLQIETPAVFNVEGRRSAAGEAGGAPVRAAQPKSMSVQSCCWGRHRMLLGLMLPCAQPMACSFSSALAQFDSTCMKRDMRGRPWAYCMHCLNSCAGTQHVSHTLISPALSALCSIGTSNARSQSTDLHVCPGRKRPMDRISPQIEPSNSFTT